MQLEKYHKTDIKWVEPRTILYVVHGSRAYGTNKPDSDYDYKGVVVAPVKYRDGFLHNFEQSIAGEPCDSTIVDIRKFFKLASDCNPNIIEIVWSDDDAIVHESPEGILLRSAKEDFLSKNAFYRFTGYAYGQLKRIKRHRRWLLEPPTHQPTRKEFNLHERGEVSSEQIKAAQAAVRKQIDTWEMDFSGVDQSDILRMQDHMAEVLAEKSVASDARFAAASRILGYDENFIELLERERLYSTAKKEWKSYNTWKKERNVKRSKLEAKFGYDTKHAMHLVRLMQVCEEILVEGIVRVKRPNAKELLAIRDGAWTFDKLEGWAKDENLRLKELVDSSPLSKQPNRKRLDALCCELTDMVDKRIGELR